MPTKISWCDETLNPMWGCSRVSEGCRNCYAETIDSRYTKSFLPWTKANAKHNLRFDADKLKAPYEEKEPLKWFINSMSDQFHEDAPDEWLEQTFAMMNDPIIFEIGHIFQILTKRPEQLYRAKPEWWTPNIWMGVSVEDRKNLSRINILRQCPAQTKFVSLEPLLEDLGEIDLTDIDQAIVGGESGPNFRPMDHAWARSIRDQCLEQGTEFYFKQSAAFRTEEGAALIEADGSRNIWNYFPIDGQRYRDGEGLVPYVFDGYYELVTPFDLVLEPFAV